MTMHTADPFGRLEEKVDRLEREIKRMQQPQPKPAPVWPWVVTVVFVVASIVLTTLAIL